MPIISHMGVDYDSPNIQIQDNASATDLDNTKIPTGQTIESYVNRNIIKKKYFTATTSSNGNVTFENDLDVANNFIVGVTARNKSSTSTLYIGHPYQYANGGWGKVWGAHFTSEYAAASAITNTTIEGYIFYITATGY